MVLLITLMKALLYSSVPVSHDNVTVGQYEKYEDPETETAKWKSVIIHIYTCAFPTVTLVENDNPSKCCFINALSTLPNNCNQNYNDWINSWLVMSNDFFPTSLLSSLLNCSSQEEVCVRDVKILPNYNSSYLLMMPDCSVLVVDYVW